MMTDGKSALRERRRVWCHMIPKVQGTTIVPAVSRSLSINGWPSSQPLKPRQSALWVSTLLPLTAPLAPLRMLRVCRWRLGGPAAQLAQIGR